MNRPQFNAKVIVFSPTGIANHENEVWGWHSDSSWAPSIALSNVFTRERTFYDRVFLTIYPLFTKFMMNYITIPIIDGMVREKLEIPDMPPLSELEKKASLFLINQHPSNDYPKSFPPFVVPVGGMHCDVWESRNKTRKLPQVKLCVLMEYFKKSQLFFKTIFMAGFIENGGIYRWRRS